MTVQPHSQPHVADFKLSITKALADQLAERLEPLRPHELTEDAVEQLDRRSGVYLLYHRRHRVYVGKAQQSLPTRLRQHWRKLRGREGLILADVGFVCLYVDEDLDAAAPEKLLIRRYRAEGGPGGVPWNVNGFGNKDPGRNRDRSAVPRNHFDARYPANLDWPLELTAGLRPLGEVLSEAKRQLPYNLRYERGARARVAYEAELDVPAGPLTLAQFLELVIAVLPPSWQATALPGYLILYSERSELPSARAWWRREDDGVRVIHHDMQLGDEEEIKEEPNDGSDREE